MLGKRLFARKSLEHLIEEMAGENRLRRALGPVSLTALGVGCIIGAGIFVMTGRAAAEDAGPAVMVSYGVAALGCVFAALCYAEFAAMAPVAGSAYTYAYATLGELFAWIIGWDLILEYAMACACVAAAWASYLNEFLLVLFNVQVPAYLCSDPFSTTGAWFNLPAVAITAVMTVILIVGIRESALTNAILTLVKLFVVLFVIGMGFTLVNQTQNNWTDVPYSQRIVSVDQEHSETIVSEKWGLLGQLIDPATLTPIDDAFRSNFAPYGLSGIMLGAAIVFFAFIGFDSISTHSEEAINPQRDVPMAILASLAICAVLYVLVAAVITGMEPYPEIDTKAAIAAAFRKQAELHDSNVLRASTALIATGALAGLTSVLLVTFLSQARIFLAMARDKLLPPSVFGSIHPRFKTPHISTALTGLVICLTAAFTPISDLEKMVNIGTLFAFTIVCITVLILRLQRPEMERPFRCPLVFLVAPLGVLVNLAMMMFLPVSTWLRLVVWMALGVVFYFAYGYRHSILGTELVRELSKEGIGPTDAPLAP
jgi:APA family basic amino acid/polyamine antiporter